MDQWVDQSGKGHSEPSAEEWRDIVYGEGGMDLGLISVSAIW